MADIIADTIEALIVADRADKYSEACRIIIGSTEAEAVKMLMFLCGKTSGSYYEPDHRREHSYFLAAMTKTLAGGYPTHHRVFVETCLVQLRYGQSHNAVRVTKDTIRALGARGLPALLELSDRLRAHSSIETIVKLLGWTGSSRASPILRSHLCDSRAPVRAAACWALSRVDPDAFVSVLPLSFDPADSVRLAAIESLFVLNPDDAPGSLRGLVHDSSKVIQTRLMQLLGQTRAANVEVRLELLIHGLASAHDWKVRLHAARSIGNLRLISAPRQVIDALEDPHAEVRAMVAWALGEIGDRAALLALACVREDADAFLAWSASQAILSINDHQTRRS